MEISKDDFSYIVALHKPPLKVHVKLCCRVFACPLACLVDVKLCHT